MLEKFAKAKKPEIENLYHLRVSGRFPQAFSGKRQDFKAALNPAHALPALIAEYKRASPSKGLICDSLSVEDVADQYVNNGAAALSILTEKDHFCGDDSFIARAFEHLEPQRRKPILRKDFIFDPIQIEATAATPASAVLLIVRICPDLQKLREMLKLAASYDLQCVVEIFDERDLQIARESGASIIQVNARDLNSLHVDRKACLDLIEKHHPLPGESWIAASGMDSRQHLKAARDAGYDAALLGTALMKDGKPGQALASLLEA